MSDDEPLASEYVPRPAYRRPTVSPRTHCTLFCCGVLCTLATLGLLIPGAIVLGRADTERAHGWDRRDCSIEAMNISDHECVYFTAYIRGLDAAYCAVPARFVVNGDIITAPGCLDHNYTGNPNIEYWLELAGTGADSISCLVPENPVLADDCELVATHGGTLAGAYRTWGERLVYLERNPVEGRAAIAATTQPAFVVGMGLVLGGVAAGCIASLVCFYNYVWTACIAVDKAIRSRSYRRHERRAAAFKIP